MNDDDAPELTAAQLAEMRPARDVLPPDLFAALVRATSHGRPKAEQAKVPVTIRRDRAIVEAAPKLAAPDRASGGGTGDARPRATKATKRA